MYLHPCIYGLKRDFNSVMYNFDMIDIASGHFTNPALKKSKDSCYRIEDRAWILLTLLKLSEISHFFTYVNNDSQHFQKMINDEMRMFFYLISKVKDGGTAW